MASTIQKSFYREHPNVRSRSNQEERQLQEQLKLELLPAFPNQDIPKMVRSFKDIGDNFPSFATRYFDSKKFDNPTPIQGQTWPVVLSGHDLIGIAETGSGKTLGFLLPGIVHMQAQQPCTYQNPGPVILILEPTRELAQQVQDVVHELVSRGGARLKSALVYGGQPKGQQRYALRDCEILIGTPGRMLDFINEGAVSLNRVTYFVLDEADQMLDMGFIPDITKIFEMTRRDRQTVMWSATWPREIRELAAKFLTDPVKILCGLKLDEAEHSVNKNISHEFLFVSHTNSLEKLKQLLQETSSKKTLVFTNTKKLANDVAYELYKSGFDSDCLHGDLPQSNRDRAINAFKRDQLKILVATDVAARGLDVKNVEMVVNYEVPSNEDYFVHRIGRTGRAGTKGKAIHFVEENPVNKNQNYRFMVKYLAKAGVEIPNQLYQAANMTPMDVARKSRGGGRFNQNGRNFAANRFDRGYGNFQNEGKGGGYGGNRGGGSFHGSRGGSSGSYGGYGSDKRGKPTW